MGVKTKKPPCASTINIMLYQSYLEKNFIWMSIRLAKFLSRQKTCALVNLRIQHITVISYLQNIAKIIPLPISEILMNCVASRKKCQYLSTFSAWRNFDSRVSDDRSLIPSENSVKIDSLDNITEKTGTCHGNHRGLTSETPLFDH